MDARQLKIAAAQAALEHVEDGMRLGIGTGSTADEFVRLLAEKVAGGFKVQGVPTSERTARLCVELGVPLFSLDDLPELDLTIDGADEVDGALRLVKGGGGALLREKIVAAASSRMIVIADESKLVDTIGRFPLPIEVAKFGMTATRLAVERLAARLGLSGDIGRTRTAPISPTGIILFSTHLLAAFRMQKPLQTGLPQFPAWSNMDCFSIWPMPRSSPLRAARGLCWRRIKQE